MQGERECALCETLITEIEDIDEVQRTVTDMKGRKHSIQLCNKHYDKEEHSLLSHLRSKSGIECQVCHAPLLRSESNKENGKRFCPNHDYDDYRELLKRDEKRYNEEREEYFKKRNNRK